MGEAALTTPETLTDQFLSVGEFQRGATTIVVVVVVVGYKPSAWMLLTYVRDHACLAASYDPMSSSMVTMREFAENLPFRPMSGPLYPLLLKGRTEVNGNKKSNK
uniref:Uncharacterized protein n=1 Tax=Anopheles maculatus TaxID=74869 RepID=A0A182SBV9_9DIPT